MPLSTEPTVAISPSSPSSDRPPLGRFFMVFCAMLALALGLAALSDAGAAAGGDRSSVDEPRAEAPPHAPGR